MLVLFRFVFINHTFVEDPREDSHGAEDLCNSSILREVLEPALMKICERIFGEEKNIVGQQGAQMLRGRMGEERPTSGFPRC